MKNFIDNGIILMTISILSLVVGACLLKILMVRNRLYVCYTKAEIVGRIPADDRKGSFYLVFGYIVNGTPYRIKSAHPISRMPNRTLFHAYYQPTNPANSYIKEDDIHGILVGFCFILAFICAALSIFFFTL